MTKAKDLSDYTLPLNINGLQGRMLRVPASKPSKREILLIYGHHASLERWWGLVENLTAFGNVTMPDLPGFGGMESFYNIGQRPTIDAFADYLASFIKLRYKNKKIAIYAISFGFVIITRMLQRYPALSKNVDLLISFAGFMHGDDILISGKTKRWLLSKIARCFATRPIAFFIRYAALNSLFLTILYKTFPKSRRRMLEISPQEFEMNMRVELKLWHDNDVRTHWLTTSEFVHLDNMKSPINLPVAHVISKNDHWLNNLKIEERMHRIFSSYTQYVSPLKAHVPSVIADKKAMAVMIPAGLRRLLNKTTV